MRTLNDLKERELIKMYPRKYFTNETGQQIGYMSVVNYYSETTKAQRTFITANILFPIQEVNVSNQSLKYEFSVDVKPETTLEEFNVLYEKMYRKIIKIREVLQETIEIDLKDIKNENGN